MMKPLYSTGSADFAGSARRPKSALQNDMPSPPSPTFSVTYLLRDHLLEVDHTPRSFPKHPEKMQPQRRTIDAKSLLGDCLSLHFGSANRYIARGTANEAFEAGQKERIVISEFPSVENAIDAYKSPDYQAALKVLGDGAVRDIRIIEAQE